MAITTVERVLTKTQLDNSYEFAVDMLIPLIEDEIVEYCNILSDDPVLTSLELVAIDMIHFRLLIQPGMKASSLGDVREAYSEDYPPYIMKRLQANRILKF